MKISAAQCAGSDPDHRVVIPLDPGILDILHRHVPHRPEHNSPHGTPLTARAASARRPNTNPVPVTASHPAETEQPQPPHQRVHMKSRAALAP